MPGTLYLCATPIGNLEDITFRVLRTLREADLIAAEDTRHSIKLLNHFEIKTPMTSYHEYNKVEKARELVEKMGAGTNIALITDAGTPGISDPGEELVRQCVEAGIEVTSLPGPAACVTALTMSGLSTRRFCFEAFLPSARADKKERQRILAELADDGSAVFRLPVPDAPDELLPAEIVPTDVFVLPEFFGHPRFRGDSGMIGSGEPAALISLHPVPAQENILKSVVQNMTHRQDSGHVRRRNHDGIRFLIRIRFPFEKSVLLPKGVPLLFDFRRFVCFRHFLTGHAAS